MKKIISVVLAFTMLFAFAFSASATTNENKIEENGLMTRAIPEGAFLYKEGLYIYEYERTVGSVTRTIWQLYSADGWCFYDLTIPENYDEEGNLRPANERVYYQYSIMPKDEEYVTNNIISVPVEEGFEIVSVGGNTETA